MARAAVDAGADRLAPRAATAAVAAAAPAARRLALALGLVLTAAVAALHLHFHLAAGGLWRDEATSVNVAALPSLGAVLAHTHLDSFPPAWVTLLHGWIAAGLGDGDPALRRLGLAIGMATLGVLWWSGRRLGLVAPLAALVLLGLSPSAIIYGDSVRGYGLGALALAWAMGALWAFVDRPGRRTFAVAQAAALAAVQTNFPNAIFLAALCAGAAAVCVRRRAWTTLGLVVGLGAVAAASLLGHLRWIEYAFRVAELEQSDGVRLAWLLEVFRHAPAPGVPALAVAWVVAPLLAAAGCLRAWRAGDGVVRDRVVFVATAALLGAVLYFAYLRWVARLPTQYWHYLSLLALLALACDVGVALLARGLRYGAWARLAAVALAAGAAVPGVAETVPVRMTNLDLVARTVAAQATADDLVVVLPWYCGITFARYYEGAAPWITIPDVADHRFHLHLAVREKMEHGDAGVADELARVERTLRGGGRVWVVGVPVAPPPGQAAPSVPPAPAPATGWRAAPYLDAWEQRLGALLEGHAARGARVPVAAPERVNAWEHLPLFRVEGWRDGGS